MSTTRPIVRSRFFAPDEATEQEVHRALVNFVSAHQKSVTSNFVSEENQLHYRHGTRWRNPASDLDQQNQMQRLSAEHAVPFQRIVDGDLNVLTETLTSITSQMEEQLTQKLYDLMSEVCERSGNVVSGKAFPESFLEMLEKVEFSVDMHGRVQLPQLHVGKGFNLKILEDQPKDFHDKVEEIKLRKSAQAIQREKERISKYKAGTP